MSILSNNAIQILEDRYLLKNKNGQIIESPDQLLHRVAKYISRVEIQDRKKWEDRFFKLMSNGCFLPNSPTLMNAGTNNGQLSACFVLPIEDNLESLFTTLKYAALIHQSGGGTGFNFSELRSKKDQLHNTNGSGPVEFIKIFNQATELVKQRGKRRGANIGILNIDHPDIEEFISSKSSQNALKNFNISVGISDRFMHALIDKLNWQLINPHNGKVKKMVSAEKLWELLVREAWNSGDPGLIFLDTINENNPTPSKGKIECTNPCGEVPLLDYESCVLGSINISNLINENKLEKRIDWIKLKEIVQYSIRFLDNVISANHYLLPEIEEIAKSNRKIGLGVMGWAELLIKLDIPYASMDAVNLAEKLMKFIKSESYKASNLLAIEKGGFPEYKKNIHFSKNLMRNATCNSIAPTGTISILSNTSYSIEPLFALAYKRVGILGDKTQIEINNCFVRKMKDLKLWSEAIKKHVLNTGSISKIENVPNHVRELFKTSLEIPWHYHLLHQKAFQRHTDNAVSKTINLPNSTTEEVISDIFLTAWKYKLKGVTVYRYGSKSKQVLQRCNSYNGNSC